MLSIFKLGGSAGSVVKLPQVTIKVKSVLGKGDGKPLSSEPPHCSAKSPAGKAGKAVMVLSWHSKMLKAGGNAGKLLKALLAQYRFSSVAGNAGRAVSVAFEVCNVVNTGDSAGSVVSGLPPQVKLNKVAGRAGMEVRLLLETLRW